MYPRRKRFCVVSQYWSPDIVGDATRVQQIVEELSKLGCQVNVITTQPHYPRGDRKGTKFRFMSATYEKRVLVFRLGMPALSHSGFGSRFLLYSWFAAGSFLPSVVLGRGRIHWVFSQRVFATYPAMFARFLFRRAVISDETDIWPEAVVNTGLMTPGSFVFRLGRAAARVACAASTRVTTMTDRMRAFLAANYGVSPKKVSVIPYGGRRLDTSAVPTADRFTVLYYGNLGPAYDFEVVLKAASELRGEVCFVIRADGEGMDTLKKRKEQLGLDNLTFIQQPLGEKELASLVSDASALVLPVKKQAFPDVSFPGKLVEYIQSGRPTILIGEGYPAELVAKYQVGLTLRPGDDKGLVDAIMKLKRDSVLLDHLSANARRAGTGEFGEGAIRDSLLQLLAVVE